MRSRSNLIRVFSYILENDSCRYTEIKKALSLTDTTLSNILNHLISIQAIYKDGDRYTATLKKSPEDSAKMDYYLSKLLFYMKKNSIENEYLKDNLMLIMEYLIDQK
ncbi:MAG: hypothetical protein QW046_04220 [Candidatus Micrarchaeaceae archaeon]